MLRCKVYRGCEGWWNVDVYEIDVLFMYSECCELEQ